MQHPLQVKVLRGLTACGGWLHGHRLPARLGSLLVLLERGPLVKLLPEARVITTSGFSRALSRVVTSIAGLCAWDAVSGASSVKQVAPVANSATVPGTGGQPLAFLFNYTGSDTPDHFQIIGAIPEG
jgi:hypothetical protein